MITVFNGMAWGFEHAAFDAAFLAAMTEAYPDEPLHFYAERDHLAHTKNHLETAFSGAPVTWRELTPAPRLAEANERVVRDFRVCRTMLAEARRSRASRLVACYLHPLTGVFAMQTLSLLYRDCPVAVIHHGNLRRLVSSRRYHPFLLSFGHGRLRHIVLGDFIRTSVIERFPSLRTGLYAIRIPGFFEEATPPSRLSLTKPITFSFLGLIDEMKGFDDFARLAETIGPSYNGAARFDLVGGTRVGSLPVINEWVHTYSSNGPMPRDVFDAQLRLTTYAVFPYDQWFYRYIASASVLDALNAGKPLIALRSPQFEELFQAMGDIGYLCDDFNEMKSVVASILRDPPHKRYEEQSQNILTGRRIFEPSSVATQLRAALLAG